ncbi:MAG: lipoyl(octanoyl) transferase LipB [Phycisphaerae bacterium]|nr:lipoyl(octanoyl) transferase LipB [Phycisphaerae bacterium]
MMCQLKIQDIGKMEYSTALALQRECQAGVISRRGEPNPDPFHLILVEHEPPVITVSRRKGAGDHLLATKSQLIDAGVDVCPTDRGGDITYHGPGQLVGYPIVDLNELSLRLHSYMRFLEQVIIDSLAVFGIEGQRDQCATGVWVDEEKICAMGVRVSRWVTMHGFALNVTPDLSHFDLIVPCGLSGRRITSIKKILGQACPSMDEVKEVVGNELQNAIAIQAQVQKEPRQ